LPEAATFVGLIYEAHNGGLEHLGGVGHSRSDPGS
jgi:hypothetical protein